jgi:hypothetical protein
MNNETLQKHIEAMGARAKFRPLTRESRWQPEITPTSFTIDVRSDRRGEYFDFALGEIPPKFELLQARPKEQHLLLYTRDGQRFLLGHDERHWFVAGIADRVSTVWGAKQSLLPDQVRELVRQLPPDKVDNRKNPIFKRQGEWFFVPTRREIPVTMIRRNEPLQRSWGSKPHLCQELHREGGETVYIVHGEVYSVEEYEAQRRQDPDFLKGGAVFTRVRNPMVYVRGYVRHPDHATITLHGWHRVYINGEFSTTSVAFLD